MICVSIGRTRHSMMIQEHRALVERGAELVEYRLDWLGRQPDVTRLLKDRPGPVVVACRRREDGPQCLERIAGRHLRDLLTISLAQLGEVAADDQRAAPDAHERVSPVASAAFDALQQERQPVTQSQRRGDGRQRVGRQLEDAW